MPVQMICPNLRCRKFLSVPDDDRGQLVKCHHCGMNFRVPEARKAEHAGMAIDRANDDTSES